MWEMSPGIPGSVLAAILYQDAEAAHFHNLGLLFRWLMLRWCQPEERDVPFVVEQ
jgi:hypothetical protein